MSKIYSTLIASFASLIFSRFFILMFVFTSSLPSNSGFLSAVIFVNFEPISFMFVIYI